MNIASLVSRCIEIYELTPDELRDNAFAICIADKLNGTNTRELDIDKFVETDSESEDWNLLLAILGVVPQHKGYSVLPRVQKLRVISDMLTLSLCDKVDDLSLMNKVSSKVAKELGVNVVFTTAYADEHACLRNLLIIENSLTRVKVSTYSGLTTMYNKLCLYKSKVDELNKSVTSIDLSGVLLPESVCINSLGKSCSEEEFTAHLDKSGHTEETYCNMMLDTFCSELVQFLGKAMYLKFKDNEVSFNLVLTRSNLYAKNYLPIGTYSLEGYTDRLAVLRNVPAYLSRKVSLVFSSTSSFSESSIFACFAVLIILRKINIGESKLKMRMEEIENELR